MQRPSGKLLVDESDAVSVLVALSVLHSFSATCGLLAETSSQQDCLPLSGYWMLLVCECYISSLSTSIPVAGTKTGSPVAHETRLLSHVLRDGLGW